MEKEKRSVKKKLLFSILTVALVFLFWIVYTYSNSIYLYPVFNWIGVLLGVCGAILLLTIILLLIIEHNKKRQIVAVGLLILLIPIAFASSVLMFTSSKTTDIGDYCIFDEVSSINYNTDIQNLFPMGINTVVCEVNGDWSNLSASNAKYYYYYLENDVDYYSYDVYAEWTLSQADFDKEIERVETWYKQDEYITMQRGNYTCFIRGNKLNNVFDKQTDVYSYAFFAFDKQNLRVRYIVCVNTMVNSEGTPYYLQLDW